MDKGVKRCFALFLAVLMVSVMFVVPAQAIPTTTGEIESYNQNIWNDKNNKGHQYDDNTTSKMETIASSGCGLVAFTNAVKYLNGKYIDPCGLADYSVRKNYRLHGGGGTSEAIYEAFIRDYGSEYNIAYVGYIQGENRGTSEHLKDGLEKLNYHLKLGRVAICWKDPDYFEKVKRDGKWVSNEGGHFMAIVDWNPVTNQYLLLDSAPSEARGTLSGYAWKTPEELAKLQPHQYDGKFTPLAGRFHVIRNRTFLRSDSRCRFITAVNDNLSLDVFGNHSDNGTNIQVWGSHDGGAQRFQLEHVGDGWHKIRHIASGKVLDIEGGYRSSGTNVILWPDNGGYNQLWRFIPTDNENGYRIQNRLGTYLDVCGAGTDEGTNVWAYEGNYSNAQLWYTDAGFYRVTAYGALDFVR